jgi:hypothetical protein
MLQEALRLGDVLFMRRFVWRRFVEETFCMFALPYSTCEVKAVKLVCRINTEETFMCPLTCRALIGQS